MWNNENNLMQFKPKHTSAPNQNDDTDFFYNVEEKFAAFGEENEKGFMLVLTKTSFCGREAQYDLRPWNKDFTKMGKGIRLTDEQLADMWIYFREGSIHENKN